MSKNERIIVENTHEPIITNEIFEKVRKLFDEKIDKSTFTKNEEIVSKPDKYRNILHCGICGSKLHLMSEIKKDKREYRYQCPKSYELGKEESCNVYIRE